MSPIIIIGSLIITSCVISFGISCVLYKIRLAELEDSNVVITKEL